MWKKLTATFGPDTLLLPCDVTRDDEIASVFEAVGKRFAKLDLAIALGSLRPPGGT